MARLDICFLSPWIGPIAAPAHYPPGVTTGGSETQTWLIARGLADRGHRVRILTHDAPRPLPRQLEGVEIVAHRPPRRRHKLLRPVAYVRTLPGLFRGLDGEVLVQRAAGAETGFVAGVAAARRRSFVYSSANVVDFDFGRIERSRFRLWLFEWGVRRADGVVVQTEEQAMLCERRFDRDATVIPSIAEAAEQRDRNPEAFLWIGRLAAYKNPDAFIRLARALPEARFRMIPVPPAATSGLEAELRDAARRLPNLEVLDPRPHDELLEVIDDAVAVVVTSEFEGMPNVFLEAWARGVPGLALRHDPDGVLQREALGGFADGDEGRLEQLAREMWRLRSDQQETSSRCRDYVRRRHSAADVIERWEEVLRGCASIRPHR